MAEHGENLLLQQEMIGEVSHLTESGDEKLSDAASQNAFESASNFFANSGLVATSKVDLDASIGFVETLKLSRGTAALRRTLANAHIQDGIREVISDLDPNDPVSLRNGANTLRNIPSERVARALNTDPAELAKGLDIAAEMLEDGRILPDDLATRIDSFEEEIDKLDTLPANSPAGFAIRSVGVVLGGLNTYGSLEDFYSDPSLGNAFSATVDGTSLAQTLAATGTDLANVADDANALTRFGSNTSLQRYLGGAGLILSAPSVYNDFANGDYVQGTIGGIGLAGGGYALIASSLPKTISVGGATFGPPGAIAGTIVATTAGIASLGWGQIQRTGKSNQFTGEAARDFFAHAGLDTDATRALADRSGEGYSPIPILMEYASQHGLSREESIDWLNSLDKSQLDTMRDAFHRTLDDIDGDVSQFGNFSTDDEAFIASLERRGRRNPHLVGTPTNTATADFVLERQNIPLPT